MYLSLCGAALNLNLHRELLRICKIQYVKVLNRHFILTIMAVSVHNTLSANIKENTGFHSLLGGRLIGSTFGFYILSLCCQYSACLCAKTEKGKNIE